MRREILHREHGFGLDGVLSSRRDDLHGILNGIDTEDWDPSTDQSLPQHYDVEHLDGKRLCKRALQSELGLPEREDVALLGVIARLTPQKGLDVLASVLPRILDWNLQLVLLGSGDRDAELFFREASRRHPGKFQARIGFDSALSHRIEAGSDFFLMPSRFEPCGLNQLYSLRYGTLPIVRSTGGLADTVKNYDEATTEGTGFVFHDLNPNSLANTIGWALSTFYDRPGDIEIMKRRAMGQNFSWTRAAARYEEIYFLASRSVRQRS